MHDQGLEHEDKLVLNDYETIPYHPQCNGPAKRFNKTLLSMVTTLAGKITLERSVNQMTHAYNCTSNSATGFSPYYLMFGQKPRLPIDLMFEWHANGSNKIEKFVQNWHRALHEAYHTQGKIFEKNTKETLLHKFSKA